MIINIPINIDESAFEGKIAQDVENKIIDEMVKRVEKTLQDAGPYYGGRNSAQDGMREIVYRRVNDVIDEYKDIIIEAAADKLAERLVRTKAAKALKEGHEK